MRKKVEIVLRRPAAEEFCDEPKLKTELESALRAAPGERLKQLSALAEKYPPAQYLKATWLLQGGPISKDERAGLRLLERTSRANYPQTLGLLAIREYERNPRVGTAKVELAAYLGNVTARSILGLTYAAGVGVEKDLDAARSGTTPTASFDSRNSS